MFIQTARQIKGLFERVIAFLEPDRQFMQTVIAHYFAQRWCDSSERALNNELMGIGSWPGSRFDAKRRYVPWASHLP